MKQVCQNGTYHKSDNPCVLVHDDNIDISKVCLNNPYCNFEEALRLLNCKWRRVNLRKCQNPTTIEMKSICSPKRDNRIPINRQYHVPPKPDKKWENMTVQEKNLWRYAIIDYNGGKYKFPSEREMKLLLRIPKKAWDTVEYWSLRERYIAYLQKQRGQSFFKTDSFGMAYMKSILGFGEKSKKAPFIKNILTIIHNDRFQIITQPLIEEWGIYQKENKINCSNYQNGKKYNF